MRTVLVLLSLLGLLSPRLVLRVPSHGADLAQAEGCCCAMNGKDGDSCCSMGESSCCTSDEAGPLVEWAAPGCDCGGGHGPDLFVGLQGPIDVVTGNGPERLPAPHERAASQPASLPRGRSEEPRPMPPRSTAPPALVGLRVSSIR